MRYKINCCKDCEVRYPGCNCPKYKEQKQELLETKEIGRQERVNFCNVVEIVWASQQHNRSRFY